MTAKVFGFATAAACPTASSAGGRPGRNDADFGGPRVAGSLAAGSNPEAAQAALRLATSRPRQLMPMLVQRTSLLLRARKRVALIFSISAVLGTVCPYGSSGGKRNRRIHHLAVGGFCRALWNAIMVLANPTSSSSWTWASWKTFSNASTPSDLLCGRLCHDPFRDRVLCGAVLCGGQQEHDHRAWPRKILFGAKTEKTAMVVGQHPPEGIQEAGGGSGIAWGRCSRRRRCPEASRFGNRRQSRGRERHLRASGDDHGFAAVPAGARSSTQAAPGSRPQWGRCLHGRREDRGALPSLQPGDPCPEVRNGNRLRTASVRVWWCGWSAKPPWAPRSIICKNSAAIFCAVWSLHPTCRRVRARRSVTRPSAA